LHGFPGKQADNAAGRGAEDFANADFFRALRGRKRNQPEQAEARDGYSQNGGISRRSLQSHFPLILPRHALVKE
jgi:hypothetical protein